MPHFQTLVRLLSTVPYDIFLNSLGKPFLDSPDIGWVHNLLENRTHKYDIFSCQNGSVKWCHDLNEAQQACMKQE